MNAMIKKSSHMNPLLTVIGFIVIFSIIGYLCILFPLYIAFPISLLAIPLLVLVYAGILQPFDKKYFTPIKLISAAFAVMLPTLIILQYFPAHSIKIIVFIILIANMLEAIACDWKSKNTLNVITGIVLVILIPICFEVQWTGIYYIISPNALIYWVIGYTLWNWNFVLFNYSIEKSLYYVAVLLAPLAIILFTANIGLWLVARATTLLIGLLINLSIDKNKLAPWLTSSWYEQVCAKLKTNQYWQTLFCLIIMLLGVLTVVFC